jgi:TM2 domain-containing membrane protein YozV
MGRYCTNCGTELQENQEVCLKCGVMAKSKSSAKDPFATTTPNGKNKLIAGIFGIFLGAFGVHKFYLGQTGIGVIYAIFFWTGISAIIGFIEGILLIAMSDEEFSQKYGQ